MTDLSDMIAKAVSHYDSLSSVDKALADEQQRRSWIMGETGRDPGFTVLAQEVLRLRKELAGKRDGVLSSDDRGKLERLKRRAYHLQNRIERSPRYELAYDKAELSALRWAVQKISGQSITGIDDPPTDINYG